jgi:hypothetical protein
VQLVHQTGAKNEKILLFVDQYVAHPKDTTVLKNIRVIFLTQNCTSHLLPMPVQKASHMESHDRQRIIW